MTAASETLFSYCPPPLAGPMWSWTTPKWRQRCGKRPMMTHGDPMAALWLKSQNIPSHMSTTLK